MTCAAEVRLEALETFGVLGEPRTDFLSDIDAHANEFGYYERVELARHLTGIPAWHVRDIALRDKLLERLYETGGHAEINVRGEFGETPTAGQAQVLSLLLVSHARIEQIDKALATLLALRRNGTWPCACDDAEALNAVVLYAAHDRLRPDFVARGALAAAKASSVTALEARFRGYRFTTKATTIPYAKLPAGRSDVAFEKRGTGTLRYVVTLRYAVPPTAPGTYAGIRIDRIVRAPDAGGAQLAAFGLAIPPVSVSLPADRVFAIDDIVTLDHGVENLTIEDPPPPASKRSTKPSRRRRKRSPHLGRLASRQPHDRSRPRHRIRIASRCGRLRAALPRTLRDARRLRLARCPRVLSVRSGRIRPHVRFPLTNRPGVAVRYIVLIERFHPVKGRTREL